MILYALVMANKRKRPQSPKPTRNVGGSPVAREATLRSGGGIHRGQGEYVRKGKYGNKWGDE